MSQKMDILNFIETRGSITNKDAVDHFHCYRLSARILELRALGYNIISDMETYKNQNGDVSRYARYRLA